MTKPESIAQLRKALREMLGLSAQGSTFPKLSRAQGFVDGYMRAMLEAGVATQKELLQVVADERARANGPATVAAEPDETFGYVRVA